MPVTRAARQADRQTEHAGVLRIGLVEKPLAPQLTLRRVFANVFACNLRPGAQPYGVEVQILSVSPHDYSVPAHRFYAVNSMPKPESMHLTTRPRYRVQTRKLDSARVAPAAARAIKKVVAHKSVLEGIALRLGEGAIVGRRNRFISVRKIPKGYAHQGHISLSNLGTPHPVAAVLGAHQNIEV